MQPYDKIRKYSDTVCQQIRWKKAKPSIAAEIENHLCDQRDAYMTNGDDEKAATNKAILQMGDAVLVGQEIDKIHKPKPQWAMIALTGIFMVIGMLVNYYIDSSGNSLNSFSILPFVLAFGIFIICYFIDFSVLGKYPLQCYFLVLIISIIGILLGTGVQGRLTWFTLRFPVSLSYLSLIFPLAFTLLVYAMRNKGYRGILLSSIGFLPLAVISLIVSTSVGLIIYTLSSLSVLCFAIWKGWFGVNKNYGLLFVLIPTFVVVLTAVFKIQNVSERLSVFFNPYEYRLVEGYLYCLIRDFLSEAVFFGKGGIPQDAVGITTLPNISTDYSLVYLIHQFGFAVLAGIVVFVVLFSVISTYKVLKEKSVLGSLIALSIVLTFNFQSAFYILDNLGYGLVSSLSLPFISYGKSALFINSALIGFMLSVFRTGDIYKDNITASKKHSSLFSHKDGKLIINLKGLQDRLFNRTL